MEGIKQTVRDWYGDFPSKWDTIKFRLGFSFFKGLNITKEDLVDEGIPVISYGQVHAKDNPGTGIIDSLLRYVPDTYLAKNKSCLVHNGDFIFADTSEDYAGVGNVAFVDRETTLFAGYHSIVARPILSTMYPKYYAYLFLTDCWRDQIRANVMGVKVFSVTNKLLRDTFILVPPIEEQKRIVSYLDDECSKLDEIIVTIRQQIDVLTAFKKSLITETVTNGLDKNAEMKDSGISWMGKVPSHWEVKRLKYIGRSRNGLTYAPEDVSDTNDGVLVLRSSNIQNDKLAMEDTVYVNMNVPDALRLRRNDLLLCSRNGSRDLIGKCILIDERTEGETYGAFMSVFRSDCNEFLHYVFLSDIFTYYLGTFLTSTVNQLTNYNLNNMVIPIPMDSDERQEIVNFLDQECGKLDEIIKGKEKQLEEAKEYRKSLIYEYVTGKKRLKEDL